MLIMGVNGEAFRKSEKASSDQPDRLHIPIDNIVNDLQILISLVNHTVSSHQEIPKTPPPAI